MNKHLIAGVLAGALVGGGAGLAFGIPGLAGAQSSTPPAATSPSSTAPAAPAPGSPAQPPARDAWIRGALSRLVEAGTITQTQADEIASALDAARPRPTPGAPSAPSGWARSRSCCRWPWPRS